MVTQTGYDALGHVTDVTVNLVAGQATTDVNLNTHSDYESLWESWRLPR